MAAQLNLAAKLRFVNYGSIWAEYFRKYVSGVTGLIAWKFSYVVVEYFGKQCAELLLILIANKTATIIENIVLFDVSAYT